MRPIFYKLIAVFCPILLMFGCQKTNLKSDVKLPSLILWAWETPENLKFINDEDVGVAFLSQTIILHQDDVELRPRRQTLEVNESTFLIAVTRIETDKTKRATLSDKQKSEIVELVLKTLTKKNVKAIQIDFDVVVSEREFYRSLLNELRPKLPKDVSLTITALASFCIGDNWFGDLPVDEAVPMIFRMGKDSETVRNYLTSGKDFNDTLCKNGYGLAFDEPLNIAFKPNRRFWYFHNNWKKEDLEKINELSKQK
jgi:hypothetical protein